jgi:chromosome partitioning protein
MNTTLVINTKGGVGKTTIATNLASYFAAHRVATAIMDYDPQGSSLHWLRQRSAEAPKIHGADGVRRGAVLESYQRRIPAETRQLILDAPAGPSRLLVQELLERSDNILIPVAPSAIDIHATASFIKDLLLTGRIRQRQVRLAVIANRVRAATRIYEPLERFVAALGLSFLTRLSDLPVYVEAAAQGEGIFDLDPGETSEQRLEFLPIVHWVERHVPADTPFPNNVIPLRQVSS